MRKDLGAALGGNFWVGGKGPGAQQEPKEGSPNRSAEKDQGGKLGWLRKTSWLSNHQLQTKKTKKKKLDYHGATGGIAASAGGITDRGCKEAVARRGGKGGNKRYLGRRGTKKTREGRKKDNLAAKKSSRSWRKRTLGEKRNSADVSKK